MEVPELKKTLSWLDQHLEEVIIIILLGLMVIIMGIQVFMRYVLAKSLPWPEELTRYLFIWFVFLGISYGIRYNIHIKVDIIETVFPNKSKGVRAGAPPCFRLFYGIAFRAARPSRAV